MDVRGYTGCERVYRWWFSDQWSVVSDQYAIFASAYIQVIPLCVHGANRVLITDY